MIDFKFGFNWLFDKLGYMPKIVVDAGVVEALECCLLWYFALRQRNFNSSN
jgi:hypothetical protein